MKFFDQSNNHFNEEPVLDRNGAWWEELQQTPVTVANKKFQIRRCSSSDLYIDMYACAPAKLKKKQKTNIYTQAHFDKRQTL